MATTAKSIDSIGLSSNPFRVSYLARCYPAGRQVAELAILQMGALEAVRCNNNDLPHSSGGGGSVFDR